MGKLAFLLTLAILTSTAMTGVSSSIKEKNAEESSEHSMLRLRDKFALVIGIIFFGFLWLVLLYMIVSEVRRPYSYLRSLYYWSVDDWITILFSILTLVVTISMIFRLCGWPGGQILMFWILFFSNTLLACGWAGLCTLIVWLILYFVLYLTQPYCVWYRKRTWEGEWHMGEDATRKEVLDYFYGYWLNRKFPRRFFLLMLALHFILAQVATFGPHELYLIPWSFLSSLKP